MPLKCLAEIITPPREPYSLLQGTELCLLCWYKQQGTWLKEGVPSGANVIADTMLQPALLVLFLHGAACKDQVTRDNLG